MGGSPSGLKGGIRPERAVEGSRTEEIDGKKNDTPPKPGAIIWGVRLGVVHVEVNTECGLRGIRPRRGSRTNIPGKKRGRLEEGVSVEWGKRGEGKGVTKTIIRFQHQWKKLSVDH